MATFSSSRPLAASASDGEIAHLVGIVAALLVHLLERHLRRHHAHGRSELALQQAADAVFLQRAPAERLRGGGDSRRRGADAHEEFGDDVDAHAVAGDERAVVAPRHLDAHDVHVDRRDLVQHRNDEGAAVDHDLFAQEAGAHERRLLGGAAIEPAQDVDEDDDGDRRRRSATAALPPKYSHSYQPPLIAAGRAAARFDPVLSFSRSVQIVC